MKVKEIQCLCTLQVSNDEYALLLNKQSGMSIEGLVAYKLENDDSNISFDFPSLVLNLEADEPASS